MLYSRTALFVSIYDVAVHSTDFHYQNTAAPDCLFVSIKGLPWIYTLSKHDYDVENLGALEARNNLSEHVDRVTVDFGFGHLH